MTLGILNKKVRLSDIAEPKPTKAASKAVSSALKRAQKSQEQVTKQAQALRKNNQQ